MREIANSEDFCQMKQEENANGKLLRISGFYNELSKKIFFLIGFFFFNLLPGVNTSTNILLPIFCLLFR